MNAKQIFAMAVLCLNTGCAVSEAQLRAAIKNNPQVVFEVIEDHPEQFMASVTKAANAAQRSQQERQVVPKLNSERRLVGDDKGKIVVVKYADFQCPACGTAHRELKKFMQRHPGEVQLYFKNMPLDFHKMAMPAAQYLEAIRLQSRDKAARFFDYIFENQRGMQDEGFLKDAATKVGADLKRLAVDVKSSQVAKLIEADRAEFEEFGFTGTPVMIVNGVTLSGAHPVDELERVAKQTAK